MKYLDWNEHLAKYFFNPDNAGKNILFYLTKQDLIRFSKKHFGEASDETIWADFITAIKYGIQENTGFPIQFSPITTPLQLYNNWNRIDTPPFIAYLILYIIPLTETYQDDFRTNNFYGKVTDFFRRNKIIASTDKINITNFKTISHLWNELEEWSIITKNCDLGIFELKKFGNPNWIHVGKPFSQCLLTPNTINKLPELFYEAGLTPEFTYTKEEFKKFLLRYGATSLSLKESILELIRKHESNELGQSIIEIVRREYSKWTGETHTEENGGAIFRTKRNYTVAPLLLQFKINGNDGSIQLSFRLHSQNDYPEDLRFLEFENLYENNGWSKTLNLEFKESFELKDEFNKWVARFPNRDVRLFLSAATYQLSAAYWIETNSLSRSDPMFLLCRNTKRDSIIEWGKSFDSGTFKEVDIDGLPENYALFKLRNPIRSHPDIPLLTLYTEKKIVMVEGLKVNFRTFTTDFPPEVEITNSSGNESVYMQYRNTEEKIFLARKSLDNNRWLLPQDIKTDFDFYIKVENEQLLGNEIAYNLISSNDTALNVDGSLLPKRNSFGAHIETDATQHCSGSNIINPMRSSQRYFCPWESFFVSNNEEIENQITKPIINNHCGNLLCGFLSLKSNLTTEEFYRAFEFYYSKGFSESRTSQNFNLTYTKKESLNFYDYTGVLDYDYETKKIVVNPSQLIFIPSAKGKKVLLIGARDPSLISAMINTAPKYNLQIEVTKQFHSNEQLLLPDAITIMAFGKLKDGSGERNLLGFARDLKIPFTNNYYVQIALKLFSAGIIEYEKELYLNNETTLEDYGWARKVFNPQNLTYERKEIFDKSFALIEYKLNEYTYYNRLWKDGKCYHVDKNWGRFLALKQFDKNIILFDSSRKRVAIPCATPLPRLLSESLALLSGLAPDLRQVNGRNYRVYENIPGIFSENLFYKLGQKPIIKELL